MNFQWVHNLTKLIKYLYGGAFITGDASSYNATNLVARSVALGEPVIYVSLNYRVNGEQHGFRLDAYFIFF